MKKFQFLLVPICLLPLVSTQLVVVGSQLLRPVSEWVTGPRAVDKIPMDPRRWYQVNAVSSGLEGLFDGVTNVSVNTGWNKLVTNYDAYYPLLEGEVISIESIRFYDGEGTNTADPMTLSIITDQWQRIPIARFVGDKYMTWVGPDPGQPTNFALKTRITNARYLVLNTSGAYPTEMEFYGTYQAAKAPTAVPVRSTTFRQAVGVNIFEWNIEDPAASLKVDESRLRAINGFSAVRHYLDWERLELQPGEYSFNPTLSGTWNYDAMYERLQAGGVEVLACIKTIPKWLEETYPPDQRDAENIPARYGADLTQPRSYIEQARVGFQFAARYGHNKSLNANLVKVSSTATWAGPNSVKVGLGLIRYIECENERDKFWKGRKAYQTAREYAANLSAFYDGHKNSLGAGVGVKNADPTMMVVIGGLATSTTDYVRAMIDWCREFRGYKANGEVNLCWDVINQHLYANDARSSQNGGSTRGAAPEVSGVGELAAAFVTMAHQYAHDMPVWITEAGYDVHPGSPLKAIAIGRKSVLETQADWILRTALLYNRVGIDRLFLYQLYDDNPSNPTQFSSMGLLNEDKTRKPAADYLYQARELLGDYQYKETLNQDPVVDRYELNGRSAYVLVVPDEKGRTATYALPVSKGDTVQLCSPAVGRDTMTRTTRISTAGTVTINVSETPVFVMSAFRPAREATGDLSTLRMYPNPTADYVDVELENGTLGVIDVLVHDAAGRRVRQVSLPKTDRVFKERIDLSAVPNSSYLVTIRQGQAQSSRRIIKVR